MRVLYLVHGHEQFSVGGAENAAFSLFREAQNNPEIETWLCLPMVNCAAWRARIGNI
jgi:hypothetical protein